MKHLIAILFVGVSFSAQAATLAPGETTTINGTSVTCQASTESKCAISSQGTGETCVTGSVALFIGGKAATGCELLADALKDFKQASDAGACN